MATGVESKCCQEIQQTEHMCDEAELKCITDHQHFIDNCLRRGVVRVSLLEFNQYEGALDDNEPINESSGVLQSTQSFGAGSTVLFDKVEANTGGGYNPTSGVFTAPVSGLYEFKCQLENTEDGLVDYVISSQGKERALLTLRAPWMARHMSAIFHVTAGHHVWVVGRWDNGKKPKIREGVFSQFSGYMLSKD